MGRLARARPRTADGARIFTRHGKGHHRRLPVLTAALADLPSGTVLDGELVCAYDRSRTAGCAAGSTA